MPTKIIAAFALALGLWALVAAALFHHECGRPLKIGSALQVAGCPDD